MKVRLTRTGGLAGRRIDVEVDGERLTADGASDLERLVAVSRFFELPARAGEPRGADRFLYRLTVETGPESRTVDLAEEDVPPEMRPLLDWLLAAARGTSRKRG